ncbi:hypothetical protein WN944_001777 [Citrus x changshan-huyou]|uniref:Uncharacterized protein n=1 Tax=Citrus x changshan-huyou TaxID=2935761 RepID=A0AAP0QRJ3_9ROSI
MSITTRANEFCKGDKTGSRKSRDSLLPFFSLASVSAATNNFGVENKLGEGGFGPVYKKEFENPKTCKSPNEPQSETGSAWNLWKDDRSWELMDPKLQCEASYPIVKRYINVALLCVQENAADRPTMLEVISMLTNEFVNLPSPQQPGFSSLKKSVETVARSMNRLTLSVMDAR